MSFNQVGFLLIEVHIRNMLSFMRIDSLGYSHPFTWPTNFVFDNRL